jgi:hypothetical protein
MTSSNLFLTVLSYLLVYHVLDVYYNGVIMPEIIGEGILKQDNHVLVVVHKKNFTSKHFLSLFLLNIDLVFYFSCADISIAPQDNHISLSNPATITKIFPFDNPVVYSSTPIPSSIFLYPTKPTIPIDLIYPFHLSDEPIKKNKTLRCYATNEALKPLLGIENWCLQLCAINCPPTLCICVEI